MMKFRLTLTLEEAKKASFLAKTLNPPTADSKSPIINPQESSEGLKNLVEGYEKAIKSKYPINIYIKRFLEICSSSIRRKGI